jgi:hypothetical protein
MSTAPTLTGIESFNANREQRDSRCGEFGGHIRGAARAGWVGERHARGAERLGEAAKRKDHTLSEWIRLTVLAALET